MTTIVYRDGVLAADSRVTEGTLIAGSVVKARRLGKILTAGCGNVTDMEAFYSWVAGGMQGECKIEGDGEFWLIAPGQPLLIYESGKFLRLVSPFYAAGSGGKVARGALGLGADALTAVRVAAAQDTGSGAPFDVCYLDQRLPDHRGEA